MTKNLRQQCLTIIRGHNARVARYHAKREAILYERTDADSMPGNNAPGNPTASKAIRLDALEHVPDTAQMRAVEQAMSCVGNDMADAPREILRRAIWLNCIERKMYPRRALGVDFIYRDGFYKRKTEFLQHIADYLGIE